MGMIKLPLKSINFFKNNQEEIFRSGNLAEGIWNTDLSNKIKSITGSKYAVPTCSNGGGIVALLQLYKEYFDRDKVMIQSNTMYGVKSMVKSGGCDLVGFIDCRLSTLMPSIEDIKNSIFSYKGNNDQLIILLSDIGGIINPEIIEIAKFCRQNNIVLVEDCAHSFGATNNGRYAGTFGDAGVYSFYATKAIFAGEGGVVITNNDELGELMKRFTVYDRFDQKMPIGINIRPSELQALLIYSVVKEYQEIINDKKLIAKTYIDICNQLNIPYIDQDNKVSKGNYYKFVVYNKSEPIIDYLPKLKTKTSCVYDYSLAKKNNIKNNHVCLPIWYGQENSVTISVVDEIRACFKK